MAVDRGGEDRDSLGVVWASVFFKTFLPPAVPAYAVFLVIRGFSGDFTWRGVAFATGFMFLVLGMASFVAAYKNWRTGMWKVSWERSVKLASRWVPRKSELPEYGRRVAVVLSGDFRGKYVDVWLDGDDWFVTYYRQRRGGWDVVDGGGPYSTGEVGEVSRRGRFEYLPDGPYLLTILAGFDASD